MPNHSLPLSMRQSMNWTCMDVTRTWSCDVWQAKVWPEALWTKKELFLSNWTSKSFLLLVPVATPALDCLCVSCLFDLRLKISIHETLSRIFNSITLQQQFVCQSASANANNTIFDQKQMKNSFCKNNEKWEINSCWQNDIANLVLSMKGWSRCTHDNVVSWKMTMKCIPSNQMKSVV